ncbi:NAD(P)-dependent oxidoreductase [Streptomyces varsoviensis]|uniref:NAD(P)-dependent oxidoreductase n=1 Tax=Streptomyces varsoviensis TaxID=67373 RepID=UPI000AB8FE77|nr:NAD(P)-dependent oxidoreductase [Streptomyces varsoviensis]
MTDTAPMPVLASLARDFERRRPLAGRRVAAALNVTGEAARLVRVLRAGGAHVVVVSSKSTTFDPAAGREMAALGARVLDTPLQESDSGVREVLDFGPDLVVDNGELALLWSRTDGAPAVLGGTAHSQNAVKKVTAAGGALPFPLFSVASAALKSAVETAHGTGQAALLGVLDAGVQLAGKSVLVVGYGVTGRAVADYARGCHCRVEVAEVSPVAALRAVYAGHRLVPLDSALPAADVVITVTDARGVLPLERLRALKDGAVVGGIGHSPEEIDRAALATAATARTTAPGRVEYVLDGKRLTLLEGPGGNHVYAGINPPEMMDISLALHALCLTHLAERPGPASASASAAASAPERDPLPARLLPVPAEVEAEVARRKLAALGYDWPPAPDRAASKPDPSTEAASASASPSAASISTSDREAS